VDGTKRRVLPAGPFVCVSDSFYRDRVEVHQRASRLSVVSYPPPPYEKDPYLFFHDGCEWPDELVSYLKTCLTPSAWIAFLDVRPGACYPVQTVTRRSQQFDSEKYLVAFLGCNLEEPTFGRIMESRNGQEKPLFAIRDWSFAELLWL
jgi:hypothetical protein